MLQVVDVTVTLCVLLAAVKLQLLLSRAHLSMYELCVSFSFLISLRYVKASGVRPDALAASA
jgi:hypothetical protein